MTSHVLTVTDASQNSAFEFLRTPQENAASLASEKGEFRRGALSSPPMTTPTGTLALGVTQEAIDMVAHLRDFIIDARFRKLTRLIDQLNKEFAGTAALVNPLPLLNFVEKDNVESIDDLNDDQKKRCLWEIEIFDGIPTLAGYPVWEKLPTEQQDHYFLFKLYRDQKYGYLTTGEPYILTRSISTLAEELKLTPNLLYTYAKLFHWKPRCDAYDNYMEVERESRDARYRQIIQRDHLYYARELTQMAYDKLKACNTLKPKELLTMLELGMKYGRISVGLDGVKPEGADSKGSSPTVNIGIHDNSGQTTQNLHLHQNNVNASQVAQDFQKDIKNPDTIRSILHVLQRSGAVDAVVNGAMLPPSSSEVITPDINDDGIVDPSSLSAENDTSMEVLP